MIHLLVVDMEMSVKQLKKFARRYAMTGGYELTLADGLQKEDLQELTERFLPEALRYESSTSQFRASNAYRILSLIADHPETPDPVRIRIRECCEMSSTAG